MVEVLGMLDAGIAERKRECSTWWSWCSDGSQLHAKRQNSKRLECEQKMQTMVRGCCGSHGIGHQRAM